MLTTRNIVLCILCAFLISCTCRRLAGVDWDRKDAHRQCSAAIAADPECPPPPCHALHMCANEADLTTQERGRLLDMIRRMKGCEEP